MSKTLLLGNEAVARGLYEAGVTVLSSYPGTPSTEDVYKRQTGNPTVVGYTREDLENWAEQVARLVVAAGDVYKRQLQHRRRRERERPGPVRPRRRARRPGAVIAILGPPPDERGGGLFHPISKGVLPMPAIFDSHAHYDDPAFDADRDTLLARLFGADQALSLIHILMCIRDRRWPCSKTTIESPFTCSTPIR